VSALWRLWGIIAGSLALACGAVAWFGISDARKASASDNLPEIVLEAKDDFSYDLGQLEPGQTRFFTYPTSSSERSRLLVQRDSGGVIRTAFASCTACYSHRHEHRLSRGSLICGRCESAMRVGDQNEHITPNKGCVAVPVPFSIEQGKGMVRGYAITEGLKLFTTPNNGTAQERVSLETR
jgi:uncharacterized membrane protein